MKRTGFTLMELLLVVAILAIVAAAAAPTFTGGAAEALAEARKSSFMSAFQNTVSGCNLMLSVYSAKGADMAHYKSDTKKTLDAAAIDGWNNLEYYVPVAARTFKNNVGQSFVLSAALNEQNGVVIYYKQTDEPFDTTTGATPIEVTGLTGDKQTKTTSEALNDVWKNIENTGAPAAPQS